jgi:site-specific DNA-methyltransferase (adenine-specific)
MKKFKGLMTSLSPHWATPKWLYEELDKEFSFDYDPCPLKGKYGLLKEWGKRNYINPPYGREITKWIERAYTESLRGNLCVMLLPSRTDTRWWHDFIMKAQEIRFIKGRLKFGGSVNSAPFPSCVVVFGGKK